MKSTLDTVFKIILGLELDSICGTNEETTRFSNAFDEASALTLYRYVDAFWKIKRFLNIGSEAVLRKNIKLVDEFVYKVIRSTFEEIHSSRDHDAPVSYLTSRIDIHLFDLRIDLLSCYFYHIRNCSLARFFYMFTSVSTLTKLVLRILTQRRTILCANL